MDKKPGFTKFLALIGTALVWLPFVVAIFFSLTRLVRGGRFNFDFLIPAEIFYITLAGGALLIWGAARAHKYLKAVLWTFGITVFLLLAALGVAVGTGLNTGATPEGGWESALTLAGLMGSNLASIALGIVGIKLISGLKTR